MCAFAGFVLRAQAPLAVADAGKFMGAWLLTLDSPQGPFAMTMTLTDVEGKVACELTSDVFPTQKVTDVSKSGADLVLKYQGDFQGQAFAAKVPWSAVGTDTRCAGRARTDTSPDSHSPVRATR